jgi:hypothetical protein
MAKEETLSSLFTTVVSLETIQMFFQSQEPTLLITNPMLKQEYHKDLTHKLIITMQMVVGVIGIFSQIMAVSFIGIRIQVIVMVPSVGVLENIPLSS